MTTSDIGRFPKIAHASRRTQTIFSFLWVNVLSIASYEEDVAVNCNLPYQTFGSMLSIFTVLGGLRYTGGNTLPNKFCASATLKLLCQTIKPVCGQLMSYATNPPGFPAWVIKLPGLRHR